MTAPVSKARRFSALGEFLRYLLCSLLALGSDAGLYKLGMMLGLSYPVAACVGFLVGLAVAYGFSVRWAFKVRTIVNAQVEFLIFAGIGVAGLVLTEALLWIQVSGFGIGAMTAKIGAAGVVFLFNFGARKALLFSHGARVARGIA